MDLSGKNLIYLGGFGGIGQECLANFLAKGIKTLAIFDIKENKNVLEKLQQQYPNTEIFYVKMDITNKDNIAAAYKEAVEKMGHFDVVVNGCGLMDDRHVDLTVQINLLGVIHSTFAALPYMDKSKGGRGGIIVNISSVAGLEPAPVVAVYSAAKFGVTSFTRSMAHQFYFALTGVTFITICPGVTDTGLVENPQEKVTFDYARPLGDLLAVALRQSAADCAKNLVKVVELAKNGAVYMLDLGEIKEIEFPVHWKMAFKS